MSRRHPMSGVVRQRIDELLAVASAPEAEVLTVWSALEDAHVLSQQWAWTHVQVHWAMLRQAWRSRDRREALGQVSRMLLAAPGSLTGRYPQGNTGRARISAFEPMPIRNELADLLDVEPPELDGGADGSRVLDSDGARRLYDRIAPRYDLAASPFRLIRARRLAAQAIEELHLRPGDTVVDLGTGTGWNLLRLADRVGPTGTVIGVDISPGMLDQAQQQVGERKNVVLVEADIASYEPPPDTAAVISTFAIEMRPDFDALIERLASQIRPGGRIAVTGLRHAERWPTWLSDVGSRAMRFFGVNDGYRNHRPWEPVQRHTIDVTYVESHGGVVYLAAGSTSPVSAAAGSERLQSVDGSA